MKAILCIVMFALIAPRVRAQTNLTELLQQGMFEEQANHNIDAAISNYEALSTQFDRDRQLAATAIFRLGECYREEGQTNEAAAQYRRILSEFPDQQTLATLSREDLAGMGAATFPNAETSPSPVNNSAPNLWEKIKNLSEPQLEKVLPTLAPDPILASLLQKRNDSEAALAEDQRRFGPANPRIQEDTAEIVTIRNQIADTIQGIMEALKIESAQSASTERNVPANEEDQEIARIQQMIQNSPDLINAAGDNRRTPLADAAAKGQLKVVAFLLDHGADVNGKSRGASPLYWATDAAQRTMVEFLLQHGADVNAGGGEALRMAISRDYEEVAETLLKAHADVNVKDDFGRTPLILAAQSGKTNFIQILLAAGADPNIADNFGVTPLSSATLLHFPLDLTALKMLLAAKADPNGGTSNLPLLCAINNRNIESAELLLKAGANPNLKSLVRSLINLNAGPDSIPFTPLWAAASMGDVRMVRLLLKYGADRSQINSTPVIFSAVDKTNVLEALLNVGANPNAVDQNGRTPLSFAAEDDSPEAIKMLLGAGADPNAGTLDAPLLCAIDKQDLASAELLLQAGADPNVDGLMHCPQGSYGSRWYNEYSSTLRKAPALWLAIQKDDLPMVHLLLKYKANPDNSQISEPPAAIFWALSDTKILQALLNAGANPNLLRSDGRTPLSVAAENGLLETVRLLLDARADPNRDLSYPPLACAVSQNDPEIVHVLLQAGADPNAHDHPDAYGRFGGPVIFRALSSTHILEQLLNSGADPNARDKFGDTPLTSAVASLNEPAAGLLLGRGADPNVKVFSYGGTPLHMMEQVASENIALGGNVPGGQQPAVAASIADLLRRHGALEFLPDWDQITVNRPSAKYSNAIFYKGTNEWNQFTLYDLLGVQYGLLIASTRQHWGQGFSYQYNPGPVRNHLEFPDFSQIIIHRPPVRGTNWIDLRLDLAHALDTGECSADIPLKFGDIVEIPETDHVLNEAWMGLSTNQLLTLAHCLTRHFQMRVNGTTTNITVGPHVTVQAAWTKQFGANAVTGPPSTIVNLSPETFMLWPILDDSRLLLSSSDLFHVLVKRHNPATGKTLEWTIDCSSPDNAPYFWVRDGDVIEVPERKSD